MLCSADPATDKNSADCRKSAGGDAGNWCCACAGTHHTLVRIRYWCTLASYTAFKLFSSFYNTVQQQNTILNPYFAHNIDCDTFTIC